MTEYLTTDVRRLTYAELWRISSSWRAFAQGIAMRWLNVRRVPRTGIASDGPYFIAPDSIPAVAAEKLASLIDECRPLGFTPCHWTESSGIGPTEGYSVKMLHAGRAMYVGCVYTRVTIAPVAHEELLMYATSRLTDGRFIQTGNSRRRYNSAPGFEAVHLPGQPARTVIEKHQQRLARLGVQMAVPLDERSVAETLKESFLRVQQFQRARGVWVPLSAEEVSAIIGPDRGKQSGLGGQLGGNQR